MYGDKITDSMNKTIDETAYRREKQEEYNKKNKIIPRAMIKSFDTAFEKDKQSISSDYKDFEKDLDSYDAYTSDEMFVTSTSFCIVPVKSINGRQIGDGDIPGKITKRLQEAFIDSIGFDYVSQYLSNLSA